MEIMKKLAQSQVEVPGLKSSKDLGRRKHMDPAHTEQKRPLEQAPTEPDLSGDESDELEEGLRERNAAAPTIEKPAQQMPALGSGLKRPLEIGEDGFPVIKRRKKSKKKKKPVVEIPWEGFSSEDDEEYADEKLDGIPEDKDVSQSEDDASHDEDKESESPSEQDESEENSGEESQDEDSQEEDEAENEDDEEEEGEEEEEDEDEDEDEEEDDESVEKKRRIRPRESAFKAWAKQQINEAVGFKPTADQPVTEQLPKSVELVVNKNKTPRNTVYEDDPLPPELQIKSTDPDRKAYSVHVDRPEEIQEARLKLPVVAEEQKIMEAIYNNSSVVIWGATGSGKTTQLPQFLFEAGFGSPDSPNPGMIAVTQPRRVAAVSMAKRVADELGQYADRVAYQIRFDTNVSSKTAIKFMTDGILLREIASDFSLSKYSIIVIDEAHERSVNTDILIGMVSRIVDLRASMAKEDPKVKPLKMVVMSATLRISDFTMNPHLFKHGPPPLVQAEGRQYPVTIHFARRTHRDYVEEAFRKVCKGHRKLPPGGMLVFLTGQNEIRYLAKRLKQAFKPTQRGETVHAKVQMSAADAPLEAEDLDLGGPETGPGDDDGNDSDVDIRGGDDEENDDEDFDLGEEAMDPSSKVHVLPLYSQLPTKEQLRVFEPPPEGSRLIVLATNVAETSLTIPGIKYVFDCGRAKEKQYNIATGVQTYEIGWISKASANQRAGRAGRTGPGHCYRLYSSAIYEEDFPEYTDPEILRTPIEGVVLQMKTMGLHNVINFPFPTPPSRQGLAQAEKLLQYLGALTSEGQATELGHRMSLYPLSPRYSKMIQIGHQHGCMPYVIALVSALAVGELFIQENQLELPSKRAADEEVGNEDGDDGSNRQQQEVYTNADRLEDTAREKRRKAYKQAHRLLSKHSDTSDALKYLSAICAYDYASTEDEKELLCDTMFLRAKALKEASQLRRQLSEMVRANHPQMPQAAYTPRLAEPSEKQVKALKQIVTAGFLDHVAIRADLVGSGANSGPRPRRAIEVPYLTLFAARESGDAATRHTVYVHPASVLAELSVAEMPSYIVYSHLQQATTATVSVDEDGKDQPAVKIRMHPLVAPSGTQLAALAHGTPLLQYGKPVGKVETLGGIPERRQCWVVPSLVGDQMGGGWPLPARKVVQIKDAKEGWKIEKFLT